MSAVALSSALMTEVRAETESELASHRFSLRYLGDESLKVPAMTVESIDTLEPGLIKALRYEMDKARGLGMAAQQVGGIQRVCVARLTLHGSGEPNVARSTVVFLNPRILRHAPTTVVCAQEGCLSVPGFRTSKRRWPWIVVEYEDEKFETQQKRLVSLDAQILQHEIDHLHGICVADGVSRPQRRQAEKLVAKARGSV